MGQPCAPVHSRAVHGSTRLRAAATLAAAALLPAAVLLAGADTSGPNADAAALDTRQGRPGNVAFGQTLPAGPTPPPVLLPSSPPASPAPSPVGVLRDASAILAVATVPKPPYLLPVPLGPFRTTLTRITGDPSTAIAFSGGGTGVWNPDARHHYSNDQPWNADQTLIAMDQPGGNPDLLFLDGTTYRPKLPRCATYRRRDDRWHPTLPNVRINADRTLLEWFDIARCARVKAWTLPFPVAFLGLTNGNVSDDGRLIALGTTSQMFVVDMVGDRVGPATSIAYGGWRPTGLGVSASGRYAWVHYRGDHNRIFDIDRATLVLTPHAESGVVCHGAAADGFIYDLGHQDIALNPFDHNEDVMIGQEHCGNAGKMVAGQILGQVLLVRLRDGAILPLTDPANEAHAYHVSGRATGRAGWVYVSYYEGHDDRRFNQELVSVKMDGSKAVERWAHLHTDTTQCYRCEAHAVPSRDGLRIIFASTWSLNCATGCGTQAVRQDYVVDARSPH